MFPKNPLFESFTLPIFDLNNKFGHAKIVEQALRSMTETEPAGYRAIYLHIPFCDTICSFCPFIKSGGSTERIASYVSAIVREIETVASLPYYRNWELNNIYFGGGTPSVLSAKQFESIRNAIYANFKINPGAEFSVEVEAKSISKEKFDAYKELGVTRVSWGVQAFDKNIRDMVNLTASHAQLERAVELAKVFESDNFDMIVGFPGQSVDDCILEMQKAIKLGARTVSLYPLDYVTALPHFLDKIRSGSTPLIPSNQVRWDSFFRSRDVLLDAYNEQNMYCFGVPGTKAVQYMFNCLYGTYYDETIGVGCGAYSSIRGLSYHNLVDESAYVVSAERGEMPVSISLPGHIYEKGLVYFPKRLSLSKKHYKTLDLEHTYDTRLEYLKASGFIFETDEEFRLTEKGKREYISIMVYLMSDHQRRLYERTCDRLLRNLNWGSEGPVGLTRSGSRLVGVRNTLPMA